MAQSKRPWRTTGKLMRSAREQAGLTQQAIATVLGFTQAQIVKWESGEALPKTEDLPRVARAYGIEPIQLVPIKAARAS